MFDAAHRFCATALFSALLALAPSAIHAQTVQVSPGPLSSSHAKWDGPANCLECHTKSGKKVRCVGCHQHEALGASLEAKRGLHANLSGECTSCHPEHKGRKRRPVDWSKVGGRTSFNHRRTGYSLKGMHGKVKCGKCHKRRTPAGRTSYVGLSTECSACHEDPHKLSNPKLRGQCTKCHVVGGVAPRQLRGADVPFEHETDTGIALIGRHAQARCVQCHKDRKMTIAEHRRTCEGCHKNPHGKVYAKWTCADCHSPSRRYSSVTFNHRDTEFRLDGKHKRVRCKKCHKRAKQKPPTTCESCHKDRHRGRFEQRSCAQCHPNGSWKPSAFDHQRATKFALAGRHAKVRCRSCHRVGKRYGFEKHETARCQDCHEHRNAHKGQFGERPCTDCHNEGDSKQLRFDHNRDARFALRGFHVQLAEKRQCKKCHEGGVYRTEQLTCDRCHKDSHAGELGAKCERCHTADVKFAKVQIDHVEQTAYPLEGLHAKLACAKCHPGKEVKPRYKLGKTKCIQCHETDDPHKGKLGAACETCHRVEKGAPKFDHDRMTAFALTGRHVATKCTFCHRAAPSGGPPSRGWTAALPASKLDRKFPLMGKRCADCHADKHDGRYGAACQSCHRTSSFADVSATVHDTGAFRLRGVHDRLACKRCHQPKRLLAGLGEACQNCHWDDDRHNNALGPFCGDCHLQTDWRPAKFSHTQTAFPLRGLHATAPCRSCHGVGTYQGTPTDCETCHTRDAQAVSDPVHTAELTPCERCHTENGFVPVRTDHDRFPLIGQHVFARCRNCHAGGVYAGTPDTCQTCHLTDYYSRATEPDHQAEGYAITCDDCHTPAGWRPATGP